MPPGIYFIANTINASIAPKRKFIIKKSPFQKKQHPSPPLGRGAGVRSDADPQTTQPM